MYTPPMRACTPRMHSPPGSTLVARPPPPPRSWPPTGVEGRGRGAMPNTFSWIYMPYVTDAVGASPEIFPLVVRTPEMEAACAAVGRAVGRGDVRLHGHTLQSLHQEAGAVLHFSAERQEALLSLDEGASQWVTFSLAFDARCCWSRAGGSHRGWGCGGPWRCGRGWSTARLICVWGHLPLSGCSREPMRAVHDGEGSVGSLQLSCMGLCRCTRNGGCRRIFTTTGVAAHMADETAGVAVFVSRGRRGVLSPPLVVPAEWWGVVAVPKPCRRERCPRCPTHWIGFCYRYVPPSCDWFPRQVYSPSPHVIGSCARDIPPPLIM
jgi:hypothetical protein